MLLDAILYRLTEPTHGKRNVLLFNKIEMQAVEDMYKKWKIK